MQILLEVERSLEVLLLDEVTADLDVLARADLLRLLREDSVDRCASAGWPRTGGASKIADLRACGCAALHGG